MKTMSATDVVRNFRHVLDILEHSSEEITVIRNHRPVARLVSGVAHMTALEALVDLHCTIEPEEGEKWLADMKKINKSVSGKVRNPWL